MKYLEWSGGYNGEKTRRGDDIVRTSKNGNVRIVYRSGAIQGKYSAERKLENGEWDRMTMARYSSDFISEVEKACCMLDDKPLTFEALRWLMGIDE